MFRLGILAFAMGCAWLQTRPELPRLAWIWGLPLAALALAWRPAWPVLSARGRFGTDLHVNWR